MLILFLNSMVVRYNTSLYLTTSSGRIVLVKWGTFLVLGVVGVPPFRELRSIVMELSNRYEPSHLAVRPSYMTIRTQIDIDAPPEHAWSVLTDFEHHPDWNPFIREIRGELQEGAQLHVRLGPPNGRVMTFEPVVTEVKANRSFSWLGTFMTSWIFAGEHQFRLEPLADGRRTRFHHGEHFEGILVSLLRSSLSTDTRAGFEQMNEALKTETERRVA